MFEMRGLMKRDVILFGEALVPDVIARAMAAADEADLVMAIGTQLNVTPAANVVTAVRPLEPRS